MLYVATSTHARLNVRADMAAVDAAGAKSVDVSRQLGGTHYLSRPLDYVAVKGRKQAVVVV